MVMAQSLFISLKQQQPDIKIDVLAPEWSLPILSRMPQVRTGIAMPVGHGTLGLGQRYHIGKAMRSAGYGQAIVIPRSWKSALVPRIAGIPVRTGYRGEMRYGLLNEIRPLDKQVLQQTVQRYVALGQPVGASQQVAPAIPYPKLETDSSKQQGLLQTLDLQLDRPVAGFMPGAEYGPAKKWPVAYFAELAEKLVADGYQVWLLGSEKDADDAAAILQQADCAHVTNLCGKTSLEEAIDLIALCELAVSNDSGLMHIAAAVGCELIALYGSSTPNYTPPLSDKAHVLYLGLECSPCFKRECPLGHLRCLKDIKPQQVLDTLKS